VLLIALCARIQAVADHRSQGPARTIIRPLHRIRTSGGRPIARCGYADYPVVDKVFAMAQPKVLFPKQDAAK
jgi:hypothetical protein